MEELIAITALNDFIFCPASLYFHMLDADTDRLMYQESSQINGTAAHEKSDNGEYSSQKSILQGVSVFCEEYGIFGKIDTFDSLRGVLVERKKKITTIYDGYVFQLYAQYFGLLEMGYDVKEICLYSMEDNKKYVIPIPSNDISMLEKFRNTIKAIRTFSLSGFKQGNVDKCKRCIYETLCSYSLLKP